MQKKKTRNMLEKGIKKKRHRGGSRERKVKLVGDIWEECWTVLINLLYIHFIL